MEEEDVCKCGHNELMHFIGLKCLHTEYSKKLHYNVNCNCKIFEKKVMLNEL